MISRNELKDRRDAMVRAEREAREKATIAFVEDVLKAVAESDEAVRKGYVDIVFSYEHSERAGIEYLRAHGYYPALLHDHTYHIEW